MEIKAEEITRIIEQQIKIFLVALILRKPVQLFLSAMELPGSMAWKMPCTMNC